MKNVRILSRRNALLGALVACALSSCVTPDPVVQPTPPPQPPKPLEEEVQEEVDRDIDDYFRARRESRLDRTDVTPLPSEPQAKSMAAATAEETRYTIYFEPQHQFLADLALTTIKAGCSLSEEQSARLESAAQAIGSGAAVETTASEIQSLYQELVTISDECSTAAVVLDALNSGEHESDLLAIAQADSK